MSNVLEELLGTPLYQTLTGPPVFVHLAAICYVIAMLIREQLFLRTFLLAGTAFYIVYYSFVGDTPLWEAIFWSVMIGTANIYTMIALMLERTTFGLDSEQRTLLSQFNGLTPGQFRRLMKSGEQRVANVETLLTIEGKTSNELYYVIDGTCLAKRSGSEFPINCGCFIGEVSMLLGIPATATTVLAPGSRYIAWERDALDTLQRMSPAIAIAFSSILKHDLAGKVAKSIRVAG